MKKGKTAVAILISVLGVALFLTAFFSLLNSESDGSWHDAIFLIAGFIVCLIGAIMLAPQAIQNRYAKKNKKMNDDITANMALARKRDRKKNDQFQQGLGL